MNEPRFLETVYDVTDAETVGLYDAWAQSYEKELAENGYVTPGRCVAALSALAPEPKGPVIDLGCGTGLAGLALRAAGYGPIDGVDFSREMLDRARAQNCYRALAQHDLNDGPPAADPPHAHAVASGVIARGHAPAETILRVVQALPSGGAFVFSLNDHTREDRSFEAMVSEVVDGGWAELAFKEHGPHIPGKDLKAMVYGLIRR